MSNDHRLCDSLYAQAERALDEADLPAAQGAWGEFVRACENHFQLEETVLFPEFEAATGMTAGPTMIMRQEHMVMRSLLERIGEAIDAKDADTALANCDSLMLYMQQHNMKEEQILYPMLNANLPAESTCDQIALHLADQPVIEKV